MMENNKIFDQHAQAFDIFPYMLLIFHSGKQAEREFAYFVSEVKG